jgi:DNA-binding NarL/FixJ family response regulator
MTEIDPPRGVPAAEPAALRLLVVDADRRVRASLAGLLDLADRIDVVGSAGHARAALDVCEDRRPDAVVIDPRLPELPDGIAFIRGLRAAQPQVRVVVVAWLDSLGPLFADDPGVRVVAAETGDLADRIVEALRADDAVGRRALGAPAGTPDADAMLEWSR